MNDKYQNLNDKYQNDKIFQSQRKNAKALLSSILIVLDNFKS